MLRSTWRGLETWHGRDGVTLADERARQQGTQTSTYTGAPDPDPTWERPEVKFLWATRQLDDQIMAVLIQDHPQSVRHIFYRMTDPRLPEPVEKSERGYRHVQDRMVKLRRSGRLPYSWITDATRRGYFTPTYRNAGDFLRSMTGQYRADLWQQSKWYCEVWTNPDPSPGWSKTTAKRWR